MRGTKRRWNPGFRTLESQGSELPTEDELVVGAETPFVESMPVRAKPPRAVLLVEVQYPLRIRHENWRHRKPEDFPSGLIHVPEPKLWPDLGHTPLESERLGASEESAHRGAVAAGAHEAEVSALDSHQLHIRYPSNEALPPLVHQQRLRKGAHTEPPDTELPPDRFNPTRPLVNPDSLPSLEQRPLASHRNTMPFNTVPDRA